MDITPFLKPHIQDFILANENADLRELALKAHLYPDLPIPLIINHLSARKKAKVKLPTFYAQKSIIYPTQISLEQCSSEQTATFKSSFLTGGTLIDLTGGFGIDTYFFSKKFKNVIYIERNEALAAIAKHNFEVLAAENIEVVGSEAADFLKGFTGKADCIYLDPARRDTANRKVVLLQDCEPNILEILPSLFYIAKQVVLKTSPMLDIDLAVRELACVHKILILAVENECKEVIYFLSPKKVDMIRIETVNLDKSIVQKFDFERLTDENVSINYALPQKYLYEPNAAILKAGGFRSVAHQYHLAKLHPSSHLYTSENLVENFAGRTFEVQATIKLDKKILQKYLPENKANIAVRNFPISVDEIRKKIGIKEGGNIFLFATTDCENKKVVLVCKKM